MDIQTSLYGIAGHIRVAAIVLTCALFLQNPCAHASAPSSQFLATDPNAAQVAAGTPYDMNDPAWLSGGKQNRAVFAYKIFAALFMLGYQTETFQSGSDQVNAFKAFQSRNGLAANGVLDAAGLAVLDQQLVQREALLAALAAQLPGGLYPHIRTPAANDVSPDTIAALQALTQSQLPGNLQLSATEMVQCIYGQCNGWIKAADGVSDVAFPVDMNSAYTFILSYFDPLVANAKLPGAAVTVETNMHEFAHYLDGFYYGLGGYYSGNFKTALQPSYGLLDTRGFYDINYDISTGSQGCFTKRSDDPNDWISLYGYSNYGDSSCASGKGWPFEEWAEAFQMYVTAGRTFRVAAQRSDKLAQKYAWLKANVFGGIEYDTDLAQAINSGCNDASGRGGAMHCLDSTPWDFTLPHGAVGAACGSANSVASLAAPGANRCSAGSASAVTGGANWSWTCSGLNGGANAACSAPILTGNPPGAPVITAAVGGNTQASITFSAPAPGDAAIDGYSVSSSPVGGTDSNAGSTALTHTVTGLINGNPYTFTVRAHNLFGYGPPSAPSSSVTPAWSLVSESFDNVAPPALPPGWQSLIHLHADGAWLASAGSHVPAGIAAHSGGNLVYFNSAAAAAGGSAMLVSPAFSLTGVSTAKLSFWMYRDNNIPLTSDRVDVYVSTSPGTAGATQLLSISRIRGFSPAVAAAGWYQYTATIPPSFNGATNYIVFDGNSAGGGNDMFLDDITVATPPDAPGISSVSGGNAQATVNITPPLSNGGSAITGYTVSSNPAGGVDSNAGSTALTHTVTGLTNGTPYTFTVTAANTIGSGAASAPSGSVTPATVPGAPTIGSATAGNGQATVTFTAPASNGGSAITGYTVSANPPDGVDGNAGTAALSHTVTGLSNGTQYTFTVTASNAKGSSAPSAPSNPVTPALTATTVTLGASGASPVFGELVTFTASVGGSGLSGTVSLLDNGTPLWVPVGLSANQAQFPIDTLGVGPHSIVASYSGDATHASSSSAPLALTVGKANAAATIVAHTPNPSYAGRPIQVSVCVAASAPGAGTPGGTVTVSDGSASCQFSLALANDCDPAHLALAGNSCSLAPAAAGAKTLTASFGGDAHFNAAGAPGVGHTVSAPAVPGAPLLAAALPGNASITLSFSAPADDGGSAISGYSASCAPAGGGGATGASGSGTPLTVAPLANGVSYSCSVRAANGVGTGPASNALGATPGLAAARIAITGHSPNPSQVGAPVAVSVSAAPAITAQTLAAGGDHTCLIDSGGGVRCWGSNAKGQLGDGSTVNRPAPVAVTGLPGGVAAIAGGQSHTCALAAGVPWCWGDNSGGQLGADPAATPFSSTPLAVAGVSGAVALAASYDSNCALTAAGVVKCWGNNGNGLLGNGHAIDGNPAPTPVPVTVDFSAAAPSSGIAALGGGTYGHLCAIDGAGKLFCWGWNNSGQLGDGTLTPRSKPVAVQMPPGFAAARAVGTGLEHSCALSTAGGVWCWGSNADDELGDGGQASLSTTPVAVGGLGAGVGALAVGAEQTCVVDGGGTVWCWGTGWFANPGSGNQDPASPVPVSPAGQPFAGVAAGNMHGCAIAASGAAECWGRNDAGQLGDNSFATRTAFGGVTGYAPPSGSITVSDGSASCQISLPATGCNLTPQSAGSKTLTAVYGGDAVYGIAQSAGVGHLVNGSNSSVTLATSATPTVFGQSVTFTAQVTGSNPGGTVRFDDGGTTLCSAAPLANGQAACAAASLAVGSHSISAAYSGDASNNGSSSNSVTQVVGKAGTALAIASHAPNPSAAGAPVAVTVNLSVAAPGAGTPTGSITVGDGTSTCVVTLPALSCALTPGGAGSKTLTASYGGDGNFLFSTSAGVAHSVILPPGSTALASSRNPSVPGAAVTFTATVSGNAPGGTVNFVDGAASIPGCAAQPVSNGQAACTAGALAPGTHHVTAYYSGDGVNPAGASPTLTQMVLSKAMTAAPWLLLLLD